MAASARFTLSLALLLPLAMQEVVAVRVNENTTRAEVLAATDMAKSMGSCTDDDLKLMNEKFGSGHSGNAFPNLAAACGSKSWSLWGGWQTADFTKCLQGSTGISTGCADCFAGSGGYAFKNCKMACVTSWCSEGCLSCTNQYSDSLSQCAGVEASRLPSPGSC
mmetsp:Transcript_32331/g.68876  ORF Transcript_32331/g.68876 Transcript_32331/m.68876 type:complete len:164 (+) Transcript_32331:83-574(+)